jgi:chromosome partitioning protein
MIVSLVGGKGGSGKTTLAVSLAVEWMAQGLEVLLVDADEQGSARTWADVAGEGNHPIPTTVAMGKDLWKPGQLPKMAESFDRVIIDGPPRAAQVQRAILLASDVAVIPCGPGATDAWALGHMVDLVDGARTVRPKLVAAVVLNQVDARTVVGKKAREGLDDCGFPLLDASIGDRVDYIEAIMAGLGPTTYAPKSRAAKEIKALLAEVEGLVDEGKK